LIFNYHQLNLRDRFFRRRLRMPSPRACFESLFLRFLGVSF
jgi:hypothetical protein